MPKSKSQSSGLLNTAVHLVKKMAQTGVDALGQISPAVTALDRAPEQHQVLEGQSSKAYSFEKKQYEHPQVMMREHLPRVSSQLFGRHYTHLSRISHMLVPELNQKVADYFFEYLNEWVSQQTSVQTVLDEVGVKSLNELAQDSARSGRISQALSNQNKVMASVLGGLTGVTGVLGAAIDVPTSLMLALKSIYQTGRAYGFELHPEDHGVIEYIFKQIDLGSVAEKQALLAALRAMNQLLKSHDVQQLQHLLGSANDAAPLKKWLNHAAVPQWVKPQLLLESNTVAFLAKFTPLVGMGVSAAYSCHLVDDATAQAQHVFAQARMYLQAHPEQELDPLAAYLAQQQMNTQLLSTHVVNTVPDLTTHDDQQQDSVIVATLAAEQTATSVPDLEQSKDETVSSGASNQSVAETASVKTVATKRGSTTRSRTRTVKTESVPNTTKPEQSIQPTADKLAKSTNKSKTSSTTTTRKSPIKKPVAVPKK